MPTRERSKSGARSSRTRVGRKGARSWDRRPNPKRREDLLARVAAFLLDRGIAEFSLRRAAEAAGTSAQLLVHYFGTKDRLMSEALAHISTSWLDIVFDQEEAHGSFDDRFWRHWERHTSDEYLQHVRLMYEIWSTAFRDPEPYRMVIDSITVRWQRSFAVSLTQFGVTEEGATRISTAHLAAIRGLLLDLLATGDHQRVKEAAGLVLENLKRDVLLSIPMPRRSGRGLRRNS